MYVALLSAGSIEAGASRRKLQWRLGRVPCISACKGKFYFLYLPWTQETLSTTQPDLLTWRWHLLLGPVCNDFSPIAQKA